jgi:hypothetical protein
MHAALESRDTGGFWKLIGEGGVVAALVDAVARRKIQR